MTALLEVAKLRVAYGGVIALKNVDFEVPEGSLVGLIGPNGAGKTTLIDALTGFVSCSGSVLFDGQQLHGEAPHRRSRSGMVRTFQSLELFEDLTVAENLLVAAERAPWWSFARDAVGLSRAVGDEVHKELTRVGLADVGGRLPRELSHGQRKLVGVARALISSPRILLLDEPAAGLDTDESVVLGQRLRSLVDGGTTMLLVDHDMGLVLTVCDYIYVLEFGQLIAQGTPEEIRKDERVIAAYLGQQAARTVVAEAAITAATDPAQGNPS
jgi:branched-chain amino acid transport system ATP-binding protein